MAVAIMHTPERAVKLPRAGPAGLVVTASLNFMEEVPGAQILASKLFIISNPGKTFLRPSGALITVLRASILGRILV